MALIRAFVFLALPVLSACSVVAFSAPGSTSVTSVSGSSLATCSKPGMALTGFTRDGHCQDVGNDDAGSHHICIQMKSDFCTVTGQPDWCSSQMPCMADT